jgi:HK97 family phage prohead protease
MSEIERRFLPGETSVVTATTSAGRGQKIVGYAAVFNSLSRPIPVDSKQPQGRAFREIIRPGAFTRALASGKEIFARLEHQSYLGRTGNGTLRVTEDSRGLKYEIEPPNTSTGRDVVELIRRKDVYESSFAFLVSPNGDTWRRENGELIREIRGVELLCDVGPVAVAAYAATDAAMRSLNKWERSSKDWAKPRSLMRMQLALAEADGR